MSKSHQKRESFRDCNDLIVFFTMEIHSELAA